MTVDYDYIQKYVMFVLLRYSAYMILFQFTSSIGPLWYLTPAYASSC